MLAPASLTVADWRDELSSRRLALWQTFEAEREPFSVLSAHCRLVDEMLARMWQAHGLDSEAAIIAVGGFGRGELYPHSDVDLLILLETDPAPELAVRIEEIIGHFWDIGLEVGHSVRTIGQCVEEADLDVTVETNLLEDRLICGPASLHQQLNSTLAARRNPEGFFEAKLLEQQQRHNKFFGVANNLEPNIKECPGGLRDLQTILWIGHALGLGDDWDALAGRAILTRAESRLIRHAQRQLARLRIDLHLLARRREDRLVFDLQQRVAERWGLSDTATRRASEQLMQIYYRAARTVIQLNGILLPNFRTRLYSHSPYPNLPVNERFKAVNDMLALRDLDEFKRNPSAIFEAFIVLARHPELSGFAPRTLRALWHARGRINDRFRRDPANHELFLTLLREPAGVTRALRRMNLYGVLARYIPAFGRITGQMQHDLFHVYTVDEHILMVVRNLRRFAVPAFNHEYPLMSQIIGRMDKPELLYLAGLFHDIAKGRGGDHSVLGTQDARQFCESHGLPPADVAARAAQAHMPPIDRQALLDDEALVSTLQALLDGALALEMPEAARNALEAVLAANTEDRRWLLGNVLGDDIPDDSTAPHLFAAAAVQVHLARLAAGLDADALVPVAIGVCPACGGRPATSSVMGMPGIENVRYASCAGCATQWNEVRVKCLCCGSTKGLGYRSVDTVDATVKAEHCGECGSWVKIFYQTKNPSLDPVADDVGSLGLDILMRDAGVRRGGFNPFLVGW